MRDVASWLLEHFWRDRYARAYYVTCGLWWLALLYVLPGALSGWLAAWLDLLALPVGIGGAMLIGSITSTVERWNREQARYDEESRRDR